MKKILLIPLLLILAISTFSKNFGAEIFRDETTLYFTGKGVNVFDLENNELQDLKSTLNKYENFKGINLYDQLKNKEYSIALEKKGNKNKFLILIDLNGDVVNFPDDGYETEEMNGLEIKYIIGENQHIYAYDKNYLIFSNDMTLFFLTFEKDLKNGKNLSNKDKFKKMMNDEDESIYKYYIEKEELVDSKYISVAKSYCQLKNSGYIEKNYLLDGNERKYKTFNLEDFIPAEYLKVELGKNADILKRGILSKIPEFNLYDENKIDVYLKKSMDIAVEIKTEEGIYTLATLGDYQKTENFVKQVFEEALFYNKKLDLIEENGYKYIEIPLFFKKIYFAKVGEFLLLTEDNNIIKKYQNGEIYNSNFIDVKNYDDVLVTQDKIKVDSNGENISLKIEESY